MRQLALVLLVSLVAAVAGTSAWAAPGGEMRLIELGGAPFPDRSYALRLPPGTEIEPGKISVFENGEPVDGLSVVPATALGRNELGLVLLLDASKSMKGAPVRNATLGARAFAAHRKPDQQIAVATFNDHTRLILPFTTDQAAINGALGAVPRVVYWTRLYEALADMVALVQRQGLGSASIVLFSDGQEVGSESSLEAATAAARAASVRIFVVGFRSRFFEEATLREIARQTGGQYLEAPSPDALPAIFDQLGSELANEHLIQYRSLAGPGQRMQVEARVAGLAGKAVTAYVTPSLPKGTMAKPFARSPGERLLSSGLTMALVALLAASLVGFAVSVVVRPARGSVRERMASFVSVALPEGKRRGQALNERLNAETERSLRRVPRWTAWKEQLELAEIRVSPVRIVIWTVLATALALWLLPFITRTSFSVVLAFGIPLLVRAWIKRKVKRKRAAFAEQLPDNLEVLASALRAGHSLVGALSAVVDDCAEPCRSELRRVIADEQFGIPLEDALDVVARRMDNSDLEQVALVAALQRQTGSSSAEVLDRVTETVRDRAALRRLVKTLTAQGRLSGWVVSMLPVTLLVGISLLNYNYMSPLFLNPLGRGMLIFAAMMTLAGFVIIRRIVDIKV